MKSHEWVREVLYDLQNYAINEDLDHTLMGVEFCLSCLALDFSGKKPSLEFAKPGFDRGDGADILRFATRGRS